MGAPHLRRPGPLALDYFGVTEEVVGNVPCLVARTGYTGEPGVELMCPAEGAPRLWDALARGPEPPTPAGLVARDTLRMEMCYALYGHELSLERTPIEAGLKWACDMEGGFVGDDGRSPAGPQRRDHALGARCRRRRRDQLEAHQQPVPRRLRPAPGPAGHPRHRLRHRRR